MEIYIVKNYSIADGCVELDKVDAFASKEDAKKYFDKCVAESQKCTKEFGWEEEWIDDYYCVNEKGYFSQNRDEVELITTTLQ